MQRSPGPTNQTSGSLRKGKSLNTNSNDPLTQKVNRKYILPKLKSFNRIDVIINKLARPGGGRVIKCP